MDFIPLNSKAVSKLTSRNKKKRKRHSNVGTSLKCPRDRVLLKRVQQVIDGMKTVDVNLVLEELQKYFPEYRRRKVVDFRISLSQILKYIEDCTPESSNENSENSEGNNEYEHYKDTNLVNQSISDMYKKSPKPTVGQNGASTSNEPTNKKLKRNTDKEHLVKKKKKQKVADLKPGPKKKSEIALQESQVTFANVGGIDKVQEDMWELLVQMRHPEIYEHLGVLPPRGFLLHGPPGCGKTLLGHAIAGELQLPLLKMAATELVTGVSGESEEKIRELFEQALSNTPCVLFIDEIDAITPKRETAQREMERRIVAQLLTCLDDLSQKPASTRIVVIGATNRADSLDPALRRAGRFDHEISLGIPDELSRIKILKVLCLNLKMCEGFDYIDLAHRSPGYVGADLMALSRKAATFAIRRVMDAAEALKQVENCQPSPEVTYSPWLKNMSESSLSLQDYLKEAYIEQKDFLNALKAIQPSAKREGFATVPDTSWEDVGALHHIREELQMAIMAPVSHREAFETLGLSTSSGILLCGPPGCGKTLLAKAIANESGLNFISVKGPELLNMYVGESERAVRQCFQRARNAAPCVIFFDELDALCPRRTKDTAVSGSSDRVVNQLLTEMDGMDCRRQVFVLAATNRPDIIDPAVIRPGRLDKILYVGLPLPNDRVDILCTLTKNGTKPPLNDDVKLEELGQDKRCEGFTGADLSALVREASSLAIKDLMQMPHESQLQNLKVKASHFEEAFGKIRPSVSQQDQKVYEKMRNLQAFSNNV